MKKKVMVLACLIAGMLCACSSDDSLDNENGLGSLNPEIEEYVPERKDFVESVSNRTGTIWYDQVDESWCISMDLPPLPEGQSYIDTAIYYYTYNLPQEYQQKGCRVRVSGDIYDYNFRNENHVVLGGHEYYYIVLKKIEPDDGAGPCYGR